MSSIYFDGDDKNCLFGHDDEGMSCPTCDAPCDPETHTIRMFIKNDDNPEDDFDYHTFIESIPKVYDITQYDFIHSYEYELKNSSYGLTISTNGNISFMKLNNNIYVMKVTFNDNANCIEVYSKSLDQMKDHIHTIVEHYGFEIGNSWTHCVKKENFEEAIDEAIDEILKQE